MTAPAPPFPTRRQALPTPPPVPGYSYRGCWIDSESRILTATSLRNNRMQPRRCATLCSALDFPVFGLQAADQCWCGRLLEAHAATAGRGDAECNEPCVGDYSAACGGPWRMNIYSFTATPTHSPTTAPTITTDAKTGALSPAGPTGAGGIADGTAASTNPPQPSGLGSSSGLPLGAIIGIAVGLAVLAVGVGIMLTLYFYRRRVRRRADHRPASQPTLSCSPPQSDVPGNHCYYRPPPSGMQELHQSGLYEADGSYTKNL